MALHEVIMRAGHVKADVSAVMEIDKLAWLHVVDRRVLGARSRGKSAFYIPGGKREPGESDADALIREIREELTAELVRESIVRFGEYAAQADGRADGVTVRLTVYRAEYRGTLAAAAEIAELAWLTSADRERLTPAGRLLFDELVARDLID